ncbi:MAG: branched-chain amino acid ABC transporter substrate-binding protein [Betaproteobacteria bacterium]|nr:MAG: branched-chain amino acid ABC transporter substrate-binding protein [Betaproteobacteria bacterium]
MRGSPCRNSYLWLALAGMLLTAPAAADVKFAWIDPLSGGAASAGINAQKHMTYLIDRLNATGGLNGEKVVLLSYDNKVDPQESLIALKKALDDGARFVFQGNGSSVALAITDAVLKYNERNPGKEVLFFNYAAVDPVLTNDKCNFWHFRFDADADMKMGALTDAIAKQTQIKSVYLINQDYSFGRAVAAAAKKMLADKRPDIKIVGDELHPLQKVQDFSPYVAKIKASGADTVITGNWSNDMLLLIKAGKDAGLKVNWYTYYGGALGSPSAIGKDGLGVVKQISEYHNNALPELDPDVAAFKKRFTGKDDEFGYYRLKTTFDMIAAAASKAKSNDPVKLAKALEGIKVNTTVGEAEMRADNHQILQPMFVSTWSDNVKFDVEKTGLGFKTDVKLNAKDTALPTTCKMQRPA